MFCYYGIARLMGTRLLKVTHRNTASTIGKSSGDRLTLSHNGQLFWLRAGCFGRLPVPTSFGALLERLVIILKEDEQAGASLKDGSYLK